MLALSGIEASVELLEPFFAAGVFFAPLYITAVEFLRKMVLYQASPISEYITSSIVCGRLRQDPEQNCQHYLHQPSDECVSCGEQAGEYDEGNLSGDGGIRRIERFPLGSSFLPNP